MFISRSGVISSLSLNFLFFLQTFPEFALCILRLAVRCMSVHTGYVFQGGSPAVFLRGSFVLKVYLVYF